MKTMNEIHRENLRALVEEFGSVTAVSRKIGVQDSQFSQWLNASMNSGTGKPRGLASKSVRRIEKACEKPLGWMDRDHTQTRLASVSDEPPRLFYEWISAEEARHLTNLRTCTPVARGIILDAGESAEKIITPATADQR